MTFEQWQQQNERALESYGNPDALCRSAFNAGRATRDGQFERMLELNDELQTKEFELSLEREFLKKHSDLTKQIDKTVHDAISVGGEYYSRGWDALRAIKKLIEDFNE